MTWIDKIPLWVIVLLAVWLSLAPLVPKPHLVEKVQMLLRGDLRRLLDIVDLCLHAAPLILLGLKLWRMQR